MLTSRRLEDDTQLSRNLPFAVTLRRSWAGIVRECKRGFGTLPDKWPCLVNVPCAIGEVIYTVELEFWMRSDPRHALR